MKLIGGYSMNKRKITSKHYRRLLNIALHEHKNFVLYKYLVNGKDDYYKFCSKLYKIFEKEGCFKWK